MNHHCEVLLLLKGITNQPFRVILAGVCLSVFTACIAVVLCFYWRPESVISFEQDVGTLRGAVSSMGHSSSSSSSSSSSTTMTYDERSISSSSRSDSQQQHCSTTFVTAYFDIPSKHSRHEYVKWIANQRNLCLLIFTDSPDLWTVQGQIIIQTTLRDEGMKLNRSSEFWNNQRSMDPEAGAHRSPWLYITWNLKPHFLSQAVLLNPFSSEFFFWIDAGYTRTLKIGDARSLVPVLNNNNSTIYFMLVGHFTRQEMLGKFHYTTGMDRVAGNMFGGHGSVVDSWVSLYYAVFDEYVKRGWFVGKDQNIMNTLCVEHQDICSFFNTLECYYDDIWFTMWDCLLHQCKCTVHQFSAY